MHLRAMRWRRRRNGLQGGEADSQGCSTTDGLVATVGRIVVEPNAGNVIRGFSRGELWMCATGRVTARRPMEKKLIADAEAIAKQPRHGLEWTQKLDQPTVPMDRAGFRRS